MLLFDPVNRLTPCKLCKFARWEGNEQVGCELNRIEAFKKYDSLLLLEDDDTKFYGVKSFCNAGIHKDYFGDKTVEEAAEFVLKNLKLRYELVVNIQHPTDLEHVKHIIKSVIENQKHKPSSVVVCIDDDCGLFPIHIMPFLKTLNLPWRIDCYKTGWSKHIPTVFRKASVGFVLFTNNTHEEDWTEKVHTALNRDCMRFFTLDIDKTTQLCLTYVHQIIKDINFQENRISMEDLVS